MRAVILSLVLFFAAGSAFGADLPEVTVVPHVDLTRYAGDWYELARLPMIFQKGCVASATSYMLRPGGELEVLNSCRDEKDGHLREAKGKGWVVDRKTNAKLKVSFFWPFRSDYWIIDLGRDYEYAVVGTPDRNHLWILARSRHLSPQVMERLLARLKDQGFATDKLIWRKEWPEPQAR